MRVKLPLLFLGLVAVSGCATSPVPVDVYRGEYFYNFETAAFTPEGNYCNLGAYKRFLEITEVISISNRRRVTP